MYTVQSGDTLSTIAANLWGDASLWYKIAEVNGLTSESTLVEGLQLIIPVGVQRNENNATTFRHYDPLEVLGNTNPNAPKPKKNKCGILGALVVAIVTYALDKYIGVIPGTIAGEEVAVLRLNG